MPQRTLGIEIGLTRLRAVQALHERQGAVVEHTVTLEWTEGSAWLDELPARLAALRDRMKADGFRLNLPAAVSLPAGTVFYHSLDTDLHDLDDVRRVLKFETEADFPLPVDDLVIEVLSARPTADGQQTLLLGAARQTTVKAVLDALRAAGFHCARLDADACALLSAEPRTDGVLVHAGDDGVVIAIVDQGRLIAARSLPRSAMGDSDATAWLAREVELTRRDAACGVGVLAGAETGQTLSRSDAGSSRLAVGLARRAAETDAHDASFTAGEMAGARQAAELRRALVVSGVLLGALLAIALLGLVLESRRLEGRHRALRQETDRIAAALFPNARGGDRPQDLLVKVEEKLAAARKEYDAFAALTGRGPSPLRVIQLISAAVPASVPLKIADLSVVDRTVHLTGTTDSYKSVSDIAARLQTVPEFAGVTIQTSSAERGTQAVRFTLAISLQRK